MKLNISFNEISRDQLLKFLSVLQDEIEKMEDKEIKNICNAGNFIVFENERFRKIRRNMQIT